MSAIEPNTSPARTRQASRRTFLRSAGVAMALPWLESIPFVWEFWPPRSAGSPRHVPSDLLRSSAAAV